MPDILRTYTAMRPCALTDDELRARGAELAQTIEDESTETDRFDAVKSEFKARLLELASRRSRLASVIRRREEMRDVEVDVLYITESQLVHEIRKDTGEIIATRPLHEHERQQALLLGATR